MKKVLWFIFFVIFFWFVLSNEEEEEEKEAIYYQTIGTKCEDGVIMDNDGYLMKKDFNLYACGVKI